MRKNFEQRSRSSYNRKAVNYDKTFDGRFTMKFKQILYDTVQIKTGDRVVDIACGNGRLLQMLSKKYNFHGVGIDISEEMISCAKELNPSMDFFVAGCENLPLENKSAQVMTVCAAYHHFPNVERFAEEAERVMTTGGILYIAEIFLPAVLRAVCNPFVRFSPAGDVKFYSSGEISSLFAKYGFVTKDVVKDGKVQLIVLQKAVGDQITHIVKMTDV